MARDSPSAPRKDRLIRLPRTGHRSRAHLLRLRLVYRHCDVQLELGRAHLRTSELVLNESDQFDLFIDPGGALKMCFEDSPGSSIQPHLPPSMLNTGADRFLEAQLVSDPSYGILRSRPISRCCDSKPDSGVFRDLVNELHARPVNVVE